MATEIFHARSSARRWGGQPTDYLTVHEWFDESKNSFVDFRHRALRHHAEGIALCEQLFGSHVELHDENGALLLDSKGAPKIVPVRWIGEQHVREDLGRIPQASEWLKQIVPLNWMSREGERLDRTE